jgi:predicted HD phosphohydrolase
MKTVSFTAMQDGTAEDFKIIRENDELTAKELPDRLLGHLQKMAEDDGSYKISRLDHVLQCATRAYRDKASEQWIIAALLHDVGDVLAPFTHGQVAAEILRPFVSEEITWVVQHHGTFQMRYNKSLLKEDRDTYLKHQDHPFFESAIKFTEKWDQNSFDPEYDNLSLAFFEPIVRRVIHIKQKN